MSDGYSDAQAHYREKFNEWMEALISEYQYPTVTPESFRAGARAHIAGQMQMDFAEFFSKAHIRMLKDIGFRDELIAQFFLQKCRNFQKFSMTELFLLLHNSGRITLLQRLQKTSGYGNRLLVFFDSKGRLADNGIHYRFPAKFVNGDQDMLLGIAKKRLGDELKLGVPFLIIASRHYTRNRWHYDITFQPPLSAN